MGLLFFFSIFLFERTIFGKYSKVKLLESLSTLITSPASTASAEMVPKERVLYTRWLNYDLTPGVNITSFT